MTLTASFLSHPRLIPAIALAAWLVLGISLTLQWTLDLVPCPMCIVQRYFIIALAIFSTVSAFKKNPAWATIAAAVFAALGAFTAARQSFLQWNPPEFMACGRDFYGMVEAFPLSKLIPAVFAGSGDCASSEYNLFGITLANASFVFFAVALVALVVHAWAGRKRMPSMVPTV